MLSKSFWPASRRLISLLAAALVALLIPGSVSLAATGPIQWCPAPLPYDNAGCTDAATVQEAVDLAAAAKDPGTIYVKGGVTATENFIASKLKGVAFIGNPDDNGVATIDGTVQILNSRDITFVGFTMTDTLTIDRASGFLAIGDTYIPQIIITNSKFTSKHLQGGLSIGDQHGGVELIRVTANKNFSDGINIQNDAPITLTDVSASGNGGDGIEIDNQGGVSLTTSATKLNRFDKNTGYGIHIQTVAPITLTDVSASRNGADGVSATSSGGFTVTTLRSKLNRFDHNGGAGLMLGISAPVNLTDLSASKNGSLGAGMETPAPVTVNTLHSKMNKFDANHNTGLFILTDATATLTDVSASGNTGVGVYIEASGSVTVQTGLSKLLRFDRNHINGIDINTQGPITLTDISASGNTGDGAQLENFGGITVGTQFAKKNIFDRNGQNGILAYSQNAIALNLFSASSNGHSGARVVNNTNTAPVTIGCSTLKKNHEFDVLAILTGGDLNLGGVVLTKTDGSTISNTGGNLVVTPGCG